MLLSLSSKRDPRLAQWKKGSSVSSASGLRMERSRVGYSERSCSIRKVGSRGVISAWTKQWKKKVFAGLTKAENGTKERKREMKVFTFQGKVTVSTYTVVEAETLDKARAIAKAVFNFKEKEMNPSICAVCAHWKDQGATVEERCSIPKACDGGACFELKKQYESVPRLIELLDNLQATAGTVLENYKSQMKNSLGQDLHYAVNEAATFLQDLRKGPFEIKQGALGFRVWEGDKVAADFFGTNAEANAREFVQAGERLEVLKNMVDTCSCNWGGLDEGGFGKQPCGRCEKARNVLDKAKGE